MGIHTPKPDALDVVANIAGGEAMTHDEITAALRREDWGHLGTQDMSEIADRLDRYRYLLEMALEHLSRNWPSVDDLRDIIREEIK